MGEGGCGEVSGWMGAVGVGRDRRVGGLGELGGWALVEAWGGVGPRVGIGVELAGWGALGASRHSRRQAGSAASGGQSVCWRLTARP